MRQTLCETKDTRKVQNSKPDLGCDWRRHAIARHGATLPSEAIHMREGFDVRVRCCLVQCLRVRDLKCVSVCVCVYCWNMGGAYLKRVLIA